MTPSPEVRLGVIGAGDVAARDYLPEAHRLLNARITAIASADGRRAADLAAQFSIPESFAGHQALIDSGTIDAVVNLTPARHHETINVAAIRAGLHVYSEKPFAASLVAAEHLGKQARAANVIVVCAPSVMVFPQVQRAVQLVASGAIGPVWTATGQFLGGRPPWEGYGSDPSPFFATGSGPLVDIGVYPLHALSGLLGPVEQVTAMSTRTQQSFVQIGGPADGATIPVEVDDVWQLMLRFRSGAVGFLRADFATAGVSAAPDLELCGERGAIALSLMDMTAPLRVHRGDDWHDELFPEGRADGPDHLLGVQHLVDCIHGTARPVLTIEHATHVIEVLEAAITASAGRTSVALTTSFDWEGSRVT